MLTSHDDAVAITRQALKQVELENEIPSLAWMKQELEQLIGDREKTTSSIFEDRLDPKGLVYLLITNIANRELCSGRHHVHRGLLTAHGRDLLLAFVTASERMVARGIHDPAASDDEIPSLKREIAQRTVPIAVSTRSRWSVQGDPDPDLTEAHHFRASGYP